MVSQMTFDLVLLSAAFNGLLAGFSLNKVVVELPTGRRIGAPLFSRFSRAADLTNGLILYPALGLTSPALVLATAGLLFGASDTTGQSGR